MADYDDEFAVDMAESRFTVPVWARRPPPSLTLPHELVVGDVLVGNRKASGLYQRRLRSGVDLGRSWNQIQTWADLDCVGLGGT